jgi:hypothetical protein
MAASDDFSTWATSPPGPCRHAAVVTPSDSADLTNVTRKLFVGGAGNIKVTTAGGETLLLTGVAAGSVLDICVSRVWSTTTTATNIVAMW